MKKPPSAITVKTLRSLIAHCSDMDMFKLEVKHEKPDYVLTVEINDVVYILYTQRNNVRYFKSVETTLNFLSELGFDVVKVSGIASLTNQ